MSDVSVHDAIFTTRAMRRLKPDPVPVADLEYVVEAATMAPSAGNFQFWGFVVVTDPEVRRRIGRAHREAGRAYIRDGMLTQPNLPNDVRRVYTRSMHTVEHLGDAPAIIVPCLVIPVPDDTDQASGIFGSIYPAIQNLILAARSRGLGTTLVTLASSFSPIHPKDTDPIDEILGLPGGVSAVALIPIGYPEGCWGRPRRRPAAEVTYWDRWSPP
jgi:nitroreductase